MRFLFPNLSKGTTTIMKGIAILSIALHNLLHLKPFGFVTENEIFYKNDNYKLYIDHLVHLNPSIIGDTLSFLGWLGVPIFVFLSGYGLVSKYENHQSPLHVKIYIKHSFIKLFLLLLPAITFLLIGDLIHFNKFGMATKIFSLSLLTNLFSFIIPYPIVVYWYIGFTFELYLLYIFYNKHQSDRFLLYSSLVCVFIMILIYYHSDTGSIIHYIKDNFIGWLPIFCFGIYVGRHNDSDSLIKKKILSTISKILLFFLILVLMNSNYFLWILMPFAAIPLCINIAVLVNKSIIAKKCLVWTGEYSAAIFMTHPLVRMLKLTDYTNNSTFLTVFLYLLLTLLLSFLYHHIVLFLRTKIIL